MLLAQVGEEIQGGTSTPSFHFLIATANPLNGFREVLAVPFQVLHLRLALGLGGASCPRLAWPHSHEAMKEKSRLSKLSGSVHSIAASNPPPSGNNTKLYSRGMITDGTRSTGLP
jgi:hypothetical protein